MIFGVELEQFLLYFYFCFILKKKIEYSQSAFIKLSCMIIWKINTHQQRFGHCVIFVTRFSKKSYLSKLTRLLGKYYTVYLFTFKIEILSNNILKNLADYETCHGLQMGSFSRYIVQDGIWGGEYSVRFWPYVSSLLSIM